MIEGLVMKRLLDGFMMKDKRDTLFDMAAIVSLFGLSVLFCMSSNINFLNPNGESGRDSSVFQTVAMYMDRGLMPYKDIFEHKGPILYIYNWIGMQISYYRGIWVIEVISLFITFLIFYKIARLFCGRIYAFIVVLITATPLISYFENGNLSEEYALPYIAGALYIFIDYFVQNHISRVRLCICGFCFGSIIMIRANMIAVWLVFCIAVLIKLFSEKKIGFLAEYLGFFISGAIIIILPVVIWLCVNGAFWDMIQDYFIFSMKYSSDPSRASWENRYYSFSFFLNNTYTLCALLFSGFLAFHEKDIFHTAYFVFIPITLGLICISGMSYGHYGMVLIPAVVYPFSRILAAIERLETKKEIGITVLTVILAYSILPEWITICDLSVDYYWDRNDDSRESSAGEVANIIQKNTSEDDHITVFGNWNIVYVLSGRLSASKYSYQMPITSVDAEIIDEYFDDLENNNPAAIVVVLNHFPEGSEEYDEMMEFIMNHKYELYMENSVCRLYLPGD